MFLKVFVLFFSGLIFVSGGFSQDNAVRFDGVDDYISLGSGSSLNINSSNQGITVEMWIYRNEENAEGGFFGRYSWGSGGYMVWISTEGYICFEFSTPAFARVDAWDYPVGQGKWRHIACVANSSGGKIFIDGVDRTHGVSSPFAMPASFSGEAVIGRDEAWGNRFAAFIIDELRISNIVRYTDCFNPPYTPFTSDTNTAGLWHFNEGTGTTTADASGNGNTGTLTGGPVWVTGFFSSLGSNNPPSTPTNLSGNNSAVTGQLVNFTASTTDPEGNQIYYTFAWGDGTATDTSLVASGTQGSASHSWSTPGTYNVRVRATDSNNRIGNWSSPITVIVEASPILLVGVSSLNFSKVPVGTSKTLKMNISNSGAGTLSGTISSDKPWIKVDPTSFQANTLVVSVTVDNSILKEKTGSFSGNVIINTNGGNATVPISVTATCVVAVPNPFNPETDTLTFSGDGVVPGKTEINIYSVNGELIKKIKSYESNILTWDGKDEKGNKVVSGIYIYTYISSNEKGVGKFLLK